MPLELVSKPIPKWNKFEGMTREVYDRNLSRYHDEISKIIFIGSFWCCWFLFDIWYILYGLGITSYPWDFISQYIQYFCSFSIVWIIAITWLQYKTKSR